MWQELEWHKHFPEAGEEKRYCRLREKDGEWREERRSDRLKESREKNKRKAFSLWESLATCFTLTAQSDHLTSCVLFLPHTHTDTHFEHSDTHTLARCIVQKHFSQPHLLLALAQTWKNKDSLCLCFLLSFFSLSLSPSYTTHTHTHTHFLFFSSILYFTAGLLWKFSFICFNL